MIIVLLGLAIVVLVLVAGRSRTASYDHLQGWTDTTRVLTRDMLTSHLWLEEHQAGDDTVNVERDVFGELASSAKACIALRDGGRFNKRQVEPATDRMRPAANRACTLIPKIAKVARVRIDARGTSGPGSPDDARYDRYFKQYDAALSDLTAAIRAERVVVRHTASNVDRGLIALIIAMIIAAAAQVERHTRAIRGLARRNDLILNSVGEGIYGVDSDGRILFANRAAERLTGFASDQLVGRDPYDLLHHEDEIDDVDDCPLGQPLRGEAATGVDGFIRRSDGSSIPVELSSMPIREGSNISGSVVVFRDTSERREAEQLKEEFIASVSHELRTPLTSIRGYLEVVLEDDLGELNDEQHRFLSVVARNTDRLERLVGDLLFSAQVEQGSFALDTTSVDLCDLVRDAMESAHTRAAEKRVSMSFDCVDAAPMQADPARLAQMVDNLVSNAIKFTPEGGSVSVDVEVTGETATCTVRDTGIGIPKAEQGRLFERFFRSSLAGRHAIQGTGLGLSISKAIVEAHGGAIRIASEEGVGTSVIVTLPLTRTAGTDADVEA